MMPFIVENIGILQRKYKLLSDLQSENIFLHRMLWYIEFFW